LATVRHQTPDSIGKLCRWDILVSSVECFTAIRGDLVVALLLGPQGASMLGG